MTVEEMQQELVKFDSDQRLVVYHFLAGLVEDDIAHEEFAGMEDDKQRLQECERRCEAFDRGEMGSSPWSKVKADARASLAEYYRTTARELVS
ncbi:MAG: hypothetical protein LBP28_01715 [Coriobacteriales bacterium]|jgi:hypothetical protein|nr:hypothetical protein [Coriobacteriales bacterium]